MFTALSRGPPGAFVRGSFPPQVGKSAGEGGRLVFERRRPLRYEVHLPGGLTAAVLVRRVAPPETLDESGGRDLPSVHVFLSLLLLDFQGKARAEDSSRESKERDPADGAEGRHDLPLPGDGDTVSVAHRAQCDHSPPQRVRKTSEVLVVILLHHVDHEGGEDEDEEADVERGDELLSVGVDHSAQQLPSPTPPVHADHPKYLEEPDEPVS